MDSIPVPPEIEVLFRLAGRQTLSSHAAKLNARIEELRPRIAAIMLEMILLELEQEPPMRPPSSSELAVLLKSGDPRVRLL
ncbi:hypothetical protein HKM21_27080 [Longimicrobium terrae]|uniref:Uncharacterized protein n=2 Tax=Longimicrobium terrae TaxID=1639882 RepID=A0A841GW94_9BACT|nr:hypothetical protein [Longimicrobium terrae]MBB6070014.1 hypothetical protein [Longimicrobium terrae]NNC32924.1 hypothetical protein [Longimicrobium terrae]